MEKKSNKKMWCAIREENEKHIDVKELYEHEIECFRDVGYVVLEFKSKDAAEKYKAMMETKDVSAELNKTILNPSKQTVEQEIDYHSCKNRAISFINKYNLMDIENLLNERIIGQNELNKNIANFLYYHALRSIYPNIPMKPMIINGPTQSGKTEIVHVIKELFDNFIDCFCISGTRLYPEGFNIGYKISDCMVEGGLLVIDNFEELLNKKSEVGKVDKSVEVQKELVDMIEENYWYKKPYMQVNNFMQKSIKSMSLLIVGNFNEENMIQQLRERINIFSNTVLVERGKYKEIVKNPSSKITKIIQALKECNIDIDPNNNELDEILKNCIKDKDNIRTIVSESENACFRILRNHEILLPHIMTEKEKDEYFF